MTDLSDLPESTLYEVAGGDGEDALWGVMLGTAFTAGLIGSGGLLALAISFGVILSYSDVPG